MTTEPHFLSIDYKKYRDSKGNPREDPIVQVEVICDDGRTEVLQAYADTGCDDAICISKEKAEEFGLKRFSNQPIEFKLADGSVVGAYLYEIKFKVGGREMKKGIGIVDPDAPLTVEKADEGEVEPLLGRGVMDEFHVAFMGKSTPKKLVFD